MKLKDFVECLSIFQGIKLIDADTKKPYQETTVDKFYAAKFFGEWYPYNAYTAADGESLVIEINTEEF